MTTRARTRVAGASSVTAILMSRYGMPQITDIAENNSQPRRDISPPYDRPGRPASGRPGLGGSSGQVEPIEGHDLVPGGHEVADELPAGVIAGVDLGDGPELGVR